MLTREEQELLAARYWRTILRVSKGVYFQERTTWGPGSDRDEIASEVFAGLVERGETLAAIENPEAYLRADAKQKASALRRKRHGRKNLRHLEERGRLHEDDSPVIEETVREFGKPVSEYSEGHIDFSPERRFDFETKLAECEEVIAGIIRKVWNLDYRAAIEAFYLRGEGGDVTSRTRRTKGEKTLLPEDVASLQVWRAWLFPDLRNRTPETEATPLLAVLLGE